MTRSSPCRSAASLVISGCRLQPAASAARSRRPAIERRIRITRVAEPGPDSSVVIPAYSGAKTIGACLASLKRAAEGRRYEIIVVESSGDGAASIIRSEFPDVELFCAPARLSAGGARNEGARRAKGAL